MLQQDPIVRTSRKSLVIMIVMCAVVAIAITPFVQDKINDFFASEGSDLAPTDTTHENDFTEAGHLDDYCQQSDANQLVCDDYNLHREPPPAQREAGHPDGASIARANPQGMTCEGNTCVTEQSCDSRKPCDINGLPIEED